MITKIKKFDTLTITELYAILQLRSEVFVVEQDCVYQDIDGKDQKALHVLGFHNSRIVAYTRIFNSGDYFDTPSIGRVVVAKEVRKHGFGKDIMNASIRAIAAYYTTTNITLSAQTYLLQFYRDLGFNPVGEEYLEDNIPHVKMVKF